MAMKDEVKEQQQKLKGKTAREKLEYFWDYYKVHTIEYASLPCLSFLPPVFLLKI